MKYYFSVYIEDKDRVDIYLSTLFPLYSRSFIQKMIDREQVKLNWEIINKNVKIKNKDEIEIEMKNDTLLWVLPEEMNLDVIFEDDNILIVNKEAWINVHPVPWEDWHKNTLVNWVLHHTRAKLPSISWEHRPWIVHRLDKDTSGIILIAKSDMMMSHLWTIIKDRQIEKNYIAIVDWIFRDEEFRVESYIWRDPNNRIKMTTKNWLNPKLATSSWKLLWYIDDKYSVLKINLETWRTHQIRVHLASIWFPIIWDKVYWNKQTNIEVEEKYGLKRQALHALELKFELYSQERYFRAELKNDMKKIIWDLKIK